MAQVTTNTEINTINILQEAPSVETDDLFLLQRGSTTFKLKSENLSVGVNQLKEIENKRVLGNISGAPSSPYGITLKTEQDSDSDSDTALVTEKRIKSWVTEQITISNESSNVIFIDLSSESYKQDTGFYVYDAPPNAVKTAAMGLFPNLSPGTKVLVSWRSFGSTGGGNGTAYNFRSFLSAYDVISSTNWQYTTTVNL